MSAPKAAPIALHGIVKDQLDGMVRSDKWTDGRNVHFKAGRTARAPGYAVYGPGAICDADIVKFVQVGDRRFWIYASARADAPGVGVTDGVVHYDLTPAGWLPIAGAGLVLTAGTINGYPFVNHPELAPYYWDLDTANELQELPGWPDNWTCRVMRSHKEFLMAINLQTDVGQLESRVSWSSSAGPGEVPGEWTPTAANDAGDANFAAVAGDLLDGISVRDQFFVAKRGYVGVLQYVGGQFVFGDRDIFPSTGLFATGAWCEDGNLVYMLTGDNRFIKTDGTGQSDLLYGVGQDYLTSSINYGHPEAVFCYHDQAEGQIVLAYPTGVGSACNEAVTFEILTGDMGIRDVPDAYSVESGLVIATGAAWQDDNAAWNTDTTSWNEGASGYEPPVLIFGGGDAGLLRQGTGAMIRLNGAWQEINAYLARSGIDLDAYDRRKTISGMWPRLQGNLDNVVKFRFGAAESDMKPYDMTDFMDFVIGVDDKLDFFVDGRLLHVEITSAGGSVWELSGLVPMVRGSGT